MRYIDNYNLLDLTNFLTEKEVGLCVINGKLEAFSLTKKSPTPLELNNLAKDSLSGDFVCADSAIKQLQPGAKSKISSRNRPRACTVSLGEGATSLGPGKIPIVRRERGYSLGSHKPRNQTHKGRSTSLGDLSEASTRKLLCDLISTLNEFFPDYDFETTKPEQFVNQDLNQVIRTVNSYLAEVTEEEQSFFEKLWRAVDDAVDLSKCEVFSLVPAFEEDDPFSDGTLWSFNYFFFNYSLKQLCYFTCVAKSKISHHSNEMDTTADDMEGYDDDDDGNDNICNTSADMDDDDDDEDEDDGDGGDNFRMNDKTTDADNDDNLDDGDEDDTPDWDGII